MYIEMMHLVYLPWLWKNIRKYYNIRYIFSMRPYWLYQSVLNPRSTSYDFHNLGRWPHEYYNQISSSPNCGYGEDFLRCNTFSLNGYIIGSAQETAPLTQEPLSSQFFGGFYKHQILAFILSPTIPLYTPLSLRVGIVINFTI